MEDFSDPLFEKVHAYAVGLLEGTLAPEERHELETLILSNADARRVYLEYVQESACLRWLCVEEGPQIVELAGRRDVESNESKQLKTSRRWRIVSMLLGGGVACLLAAVAAHWWWAENGGNVAAPKAGEAVPVLMLEVP